MKVERPLRVVVIGCGRVGALHAEAIRESPDAILVGVCDTDVEKAGALAARFGVEAYGTHGEMLERRRPDAACVATPDAEHRAPVLDALRSGGHVFCEKPLATRRDEAEEMVEEARRAGRWLAVDFNRRFGFGYRRAAELIGAGAIGAVSGVTIQVIDGPPAEHVRTSATVMTTTLLTHHFDLSRLLAGEPAWIETAGSMDEESGLLSHAAVTIGFAGGAMGLIAADYVAGHRRTWERATIVGRSGRIVVDDVTRGVHLYGLDPDEERCWRPDGFGEQGAFPRTIRDHVSDFLSKARRGESPSVTGEDGLAAMRIAEACASSWRSGRREPCR